MCKRIRLNLQNAIWITASFSKEKNIIFLNLFVEHWDILQLLTYQNINFNCCYRAGNEQNNYLNIHIKIYIVKFSINSNQYET